MAKRIHRSLSYEKNQLRKLKQYVPALSNILYLLDEAFGSEWTDSHTWTYTMGINFKDLTKEEFSEVKKVLNLPSLTKEISESGVTFRTELVINKEVKWGREYQDTLTIDFKWDLPDTCEVEYEEHYQEVEPEDVRVTDGKVSLRKLKPVINCGEKEMMKALFKEQGGTA